MIQILVKKPLILLTTSRRPTKDMRTFCKDLSYAFQNIVRINRGKLSLEGIAEKALELDAEKVMIIDRWKGGSGKMQLFKISEKGLDAVSPIIYLGGIKLRRDFMENTTRGRRIKSIAITVSPKPLLETKKFGNALSDFFIVPILSPEEAVDKNYDAAMQISTDPSNHIIVTFKLIPELVEVGPQIRISHLIGS